MKSKRFKLIIPLAIALFFNVQVSAQWNQLMGPEGDYVTTMASSGSTVLCGTYNGFIYRSDDNGINWRESVKGFESKVRSDAMETNGTIAFCSHEFGVPYRSTDNGRTWSVNYSQPLNGGPIEFYSIFGNIVFSGCNADGLVTSTDLGLTWARTAQGIGRYETIRQMAAIGNQYFAVTQSHGVYTSTENGLNWISINSGLPAVELTCILSVDTILYVGAYERGIYKSTNKGQNWFEVNNGLTGLKPSSMTNIGNTIFANMFQSGIFKSTDGGSNWINVIGTVPLDYYVNLTNSADNLILSSGMEMYISTNLGTSWNDINTNGRSNDTVVFTLNKNNHIYVCNKQGAIHYSSDNGVNWNFRSAGIGEKPRGFVSSGNSLFLGTVNRGVLKSTDKGLTWNPANNGITYREVNSMYEYDNVLYVAVNGDGIFKSFDEGNSWTEIVCDRIINYLFGPMIVIDNTIVFVENEGVFKSTNSGQNWKKVANYTLLSNDFVQSSFAGGGAMFFNGTNGLYYSTNSGDNWTRVNHQYLQNNVGGVYYDGEVLSIAKEFNVYKSTNFGVSLNSTPYGMVYPSKKNIFDYMNGRLYSGTENSVYSIEYSSFSEKSFVDFSPSEFIYPGAEDTIPIRCDTELNFIPQMSVTGNLITGAEQRATTVRFKITENDQMIYSSTKTIKLTNGQTATVQFDTCKLMPQNESVLNLTAYTFSPSDTVESNDTISTNIFFKNFNFGESVAATGTYYFANSTPGASCAPVQPEYWWIDTSGSTFLIKNGIPQVPLSSGNIDNGTFLLENIFAPGAEFKFYSADYDDVEISTNGVIGLGTGVNGLNSLPVSLDNPNAPCPALYPFWIDLDFSDPDVTGKSLKYKKSGDMLVITFDRVPVKYTPYDADHFVTFQIVLEPRFTENGILLFMFNYWKSGLNFILRYENDDLQAHATGIKGCQPDEYAQYCYRNDAGRLIVKGPIIEQQLAVAFGSSTTVLPVELLTFTASQILNTVELKWTTSREINNMGFTIERKSNDDEWTEVGFVNGGGNVSENRNYFFVDNAPGNGTLRYRLKQSDFNGSVNYFVLNDEIVLAMPMDFRLAQNFPNPFNPVTRIDYDIPEDANVKLIVFDISGREITKLENGFRKAGRYSVFFNGINLSSGVYFYMLKANEFKGMKRMVLIK